MVDNALQLATLLRWPATRYSVEKQNFCFFTRQLQNLPPHEGTFLPMKEREKKKENEKRKKEEEL